MAANIMQNWDFLKPKRDFYESATAPIKDTQALQAALLANQKAQAELPYAAASQEAMIGQALAQTGLIGSETGMNQFRMQNPWLLAPTETGAMMTALGNGGMPGMGGGQMGGMNPQMMEILQKKLLANFRTPEEQAVATAQATNQILSENQAAADSAAAISVEKNLDRFKNAYDKLSVFERGPQSNFNPTKILGDDYTEAKNAESQLINDFTRLAQQGHINQSDVDRVKDAKIGLDMPPEAFDSIYRLMRAGALREGEKAEFYSVGGNRGIDNSTLNTLWSLYQKERPTTNGKGDPNYEYIDSWEDFLNPAIVENLKAGERIMPRFTDPLKMSIKDFEALPLFEQEKIEKRLSKIEQFRGNNE